MTRVRLMLLALLTCSAALLLAPVTAHASSVAVNGTGAIYYAGIGETNAVTVSGAGPGLLTISDTGPGVSVADGDGAGGCVVAGSSATCPVTGQLEVQLLDLNDSLTIAAGVTGSLLADLGTGDDSYDGTAAAMDAHVLDGAGADTVLAGSGTDELTEYPDRSGDDGDVFSGGLGWDTLSYVGSTQPLIITEDGVANDGVYSGENDNVGSDIESIVAGSGSDEITDSGAMTWVDAGAGNDVIVADPSPASGQDLYGGGDGTDEVRYDARSGDLDVNLLTGTGGEAGENDIVNEMENVLGGSGDDHLRGTNAANVLLGGDGNDTIEGDVEVGGASQPDQLVGGAGNDQITGSDAGDTITAGSGDDTIDALAGNDIIDAGDGASTVDGGPDDDTIIVGDGTGSTVHAGSGNDDITTGNGADLIWDDAGSDTVKSGAGNDVLTATTTADAADDYDGGPGTGDLLTYEHRTGAVTVTIDDAANDGDSGGAEGDNVRSGIEQLAGTDGNDDLTGSSASETFLPGAGSDVVHAGAGNDTISESDTDSATPNTIDPGPGDDTINAGAGYDVIEQGSAPDGADTINGNASGDTTLDYSQRTTPVVVTPDVAQTADDGAMNEHDAVNAAIAQVNGGSAGDTLDASGASKSTSLAGNDGDDTLTGNAGANTLMGGGGDDVLDGRSSLDDLSGGGGDDTLDGGAGGDDINGNAGDDLLLCGPDDQQPDHFTGETGNDTLDCSTRTAALRIDVSNAADVINGDDDGEAGEHDNIADDIEILRAGSGTDTLVGSQHAETLDAGAGDDTIGAGWGDDTVLAGPGNDTIDGDYGDDELHGNAGNDAVTAGPGDDVMVADATSDGADTYGAGSDITEVGLHDVVTYAARTGAVKVTVGADANDGAAGEGDDIRLNVDDVIGGSGPDLLAAGDWYAELHGGPGNDTIQAGSWWDILDGGAGTDRLVATYRGAMTLSPTRLTGPGVDALTGFELATLTGGPAGQRINAASFRGPVTILGLGGNDTLTGGSGADVLRGGTGNDTITGSAGADTVYGESGRDTLLLRDRRADKRVDCGATRGDTARLDTKDPRARGCEKVKRS